MNAGKIGIYDQGKLVFDESINNVLSVIAYTDDFKVVKILVEEKEVFALNAGAEWNILDEFTNVYHEGKTLYGSTLNNLSLIHI